MDRECVICRKTFEIQRSNQVCCSEKCKQVRKSRMKSEWRANLRKDIKKLCRHCGKAMNGENNRLKYHRECVVKILTDIVKKNGILLSCDKEKQKRYNISDYEIFKNVTKRKKKTINEAYSEKNLAKIYDKWIDCCRNNRDLADKLHMTSSQVQYAIKTYIRINNITDVPDLNFNAVDLMITFLKNGGNREMTADEIHISSNTLIKRLRYIAEKYGINLLDRDIFNCYHEESAEKVVETNKRKPKNTVLIRSLSEAIIMQACEDYIKYMEMQDNAVKKAGLRELDAFFESQWAEALTDLDPVALRDEIIKRTKSVRN